FVAVLLAQVRPLRAHGRVAVLDVIGGVLNRARAEIHPQHRLDAQLAAEIDELVGAELIGFDGAPGQLASPRAFVPRADAVAPVVAADEIPARVTHDRHL